MIPRWSLSVVLILGLLDLALFPLLISRLRQAHFTQLIRDEGPSSHKVKEGTPTGGGIMLVINVAVVTIAYICAGSRGPWSGLDTATLLFVAVNFLSGLIDDLLKEAKHRNDGLLGYQKLLIQTAAAALFFLVSRSDVISVVCTTGGRVLVAGWSFYLVAMFYAVGMVNAFNLTDGLDGLLAKVSLPVFVVAVVASCVLPSGLSGFLPLAGLAFVLSFLWFNGTRASLFMGDTGSLALGAIFVAWIFGSGNELSSLLLGGLFLVEAVSVILQVLVFKLSRRKKRLFLMAPIHHHFEKLGWEEPKIVDRFFVVSALFAVAGALAMSWK